MSDHRVLVRVPEECHAALTADAKRNKRTVAESAAAALRLSLGGSLSAPVHESRVENEDVRSVTRKTSANWAWVFLKALLVEGWLVRTGDGMLSPHPALSRLVEDAA